MKVTKVPNMKSITDPPTAEKLASGLHDDRLQKHRDQAGTSFPDAT